MTEHIIKDLRDKGFDDQQIIDAMEDGEYLGKAGIDQQTAEEVHTALIEGRVTNTNWRTK